MVKIKTKSTGNLFKEFKEKAEKEAMLKRVQLVRALAAATPVDTGEAQQGWHIKGTSIVNNVSHIEMLNNGHSEQAPAHFIETTLLQNDVIPAGIVITSKPS